MTTAVWRDEDAFQNAKKSAAEGFKKIGFNPPEVMRTLKVEIERAVSALTLLMTRLRDPLLGQSYLWEAP
ncbi:MAG TPA: hypothetical protein VKZ53_16170 [Candidatus Angelobacter sp.]|nr:hypothetical protein [Candidatus Angelobacter sp.]